MYKITEWSKVKAKQLGVTIKISTLNNKKLDVYKDNKKIASIGDVRYGDYPTFVLTKGKEYADKRRALYKKRFEKTRNIIGTPSYYASNILW
jgi:hypothetical protein